MIAKLAAGAFAGLLTTVALGADAPKPAAPAAATTPSVTFTNKLIEGKKTWVPSTPTIPAAGSVIITLVNELEDPHGFSIIGLVDQVVVNGKETKTMTVSTKDKKGAHKFACGIHPAHVGGEVTVQ